MLIITLFGGYNTGILEMDKVSKQTKLLDPQVIVMALLLSVISWLCISVVSSSSAIAAIQEQQVEDKRINVIVNTVIPEIMVTLGRIELNQVHMKETFNLKLDGYAKSAQGLAATLTQYNYLDDPDLIEEAKKRKKKKKKRLVATQMDDRNSELQWVNEEDEL